VTMALWPQLIPAPQILTRTRRTSKNPRHMVTRKRNHRHFTSTNHSQACKKRALMQPVHYSVSSSTRS
jgi:hypothetical protein